jgi:hypothetical protein
MKRITTFRATMDRIYDGGPIILYRVNINSFPDYTHLLQENYVKYKHFLPLLKLVSKVLCNVFIVMLYVCIPRSFLVINVCNQGKTLCSPCIIILTTVLQLPTVFSTVTCCTGL